MLASDFILNGQAYGDVASRLMQNNMDPRALRPWVSAVDGRSYVTLNQNGKLQNVPLIGNAAATLRYDEWKFFDNVVQKAAGPRLRAFADLRANGQVLNIPNAMSKTIIQSSTRGRITPATVSMDGLRRSERDRPHFDVQFFPIPIVHKDFGFSLREISESRNGGPGLDTTMAEDAAEQCAIEVEKMAVGASASYSFGGATIYGYGNHPARLTKTLTAPTAWGGGGPNVLLTEVLDMRQKLYDKGFTGPFRIYASPGWDTYFDADFSSAKGDITLRDRILKLNGVQDIVTLDYLTGFRLLMVQMTSSVARAIIGMDLTTLQWETQGGMYINFKVMGILLTQVRADAYGVAGICDGTVP